MRLSQSLIFIMSCQLLDAGGILFICYLFIYIFISAVISRHSLFVVFLAMVVLAVICLGYLKNYYVM